MLAREVLIQQDAGLVGSDILAEWLDSIKNLFFSLVSMSSIIHGCPSICAVFWQGGKPTALSLPGAGLITAMTWITPDIVTVANLLEFV